jgi:hypothetical protein
MRSLLLLASLVIGCGGPAITGGDPPDVDAPPPTGGLPTWRLEDVNPASPRVGQTYGLDTFSGQVVVVTLLQGF